MNRMHRALQLIDFGRNLVFKQLLPNKERLDLMFELMWLYQRLGIRWLVQKTGILKLMGQLGQMESLLPKIPPPQLKYTIRDITPAEGETRYRVRIHTRVYYESGFHGDECRNYPSLGRERLRSRYATKSDLLWRATPS